MSNVSGQIAPSATTLTTLYTGAGDTSGRIYVTNTSTTPTTFRLSVQLAAAADNVKQYIAYDQTISANETKIYSPLAISNTDVIKCYATLATVSFTFNGVQR